MMRFGRIYSAGVFLIVRPNAAASLRLFENVLERFVLKCVRTFCPKMCSNVLSENVYEHLVRE
jgi:hypothetical protein